MGAQPPNLAAMTHPAPQITQFKQTLGDVRKRLFEDGVRAAVIHLNGLTGFRFTALYRFGESAVSSVFFYDRLHPTVVTSPEIPLISAYCKEVQEHGRAFCTTSGLSTAQANAPQSRVQSFCGVPLIDSEGSMFGTLCHFDFAARSLDPHHIELMQSVAELLREHDRFVLAQLELAGKRRWD